jgi:uncharacterized membrane protein
MATATTALDRTPPAASATGVAAAAARTRLPSIDALRGFVMVVMLLDHVRETWFLHRQLADPVDALTVDPGLFFTRLTSTLCAPIFVALTGVGAWLFAQNHSHRETTEYLLKRGLFLMVLDVTLITFVWTTKVPPTIWLQVIWCIGVAMIALAALRHLPRNALVALGLVVVGGHNLLDGIRFAPGDALYVPWALLHQRDLIALPFGAVARTSYPVLPWIGVIALGYGLGPWFARDVDPAVRGRRLLRLGAGMLLAFVALRALNVYGDRPWTAVDGDPLRTFMSFLALTKYPPSLLFLLPTLGVGAILLALFERATDAGWIRALAVFGGAPMFFYVLHLCVLRILYHVAYAIWGPTQGTVFGVGSLGWVWAWYLALIVPLYFPTAWFSRLKAKRKDVAWLKYL